MSNPYAPDEPSDLLWLEHANLVGGNLGSVAYGASLVVYLMTVRALYRKPTRRTTDWVLFVFITALSITGLLFIALNIQTEQLDFVSDRDFPGGPEAYDAAKYNTAVWVIANASFVITEWLADGFLLYRCFMAFRFNIFIVAIPVLIYLSCIALGIILLFQAAQPNATLWTKTTLNFGLPYFSLSAALNIIVTALIAGKLLIHRHNLRRALGPEHVSSIPYASIAAILVESSSLYAVFSIIFIGCYGAGSNASLLFLPVLSQIQVLAPTLIVYRIATLKAWDSTISSSGGTASSLHFGARRGHGAQHDDALDSQHAPTKHIAMHMLPSESGTSAGLETEEHKF